jgi:hypothetical protein
MKEFAPPLLLLAALLAFSLFTSGVTKRQTDRWLDELAQCDALAVDEDWDGAVSLLEQSYRDWCRSRLYLQITASHDTVDSAEAMYLRADAFARTEEITEFRAEVAGLRAQLRVLGEVDRLTLGNVF